MSLTIRKRIYLFFSFIIFLYGCTKTDADKDKVTGLSPTYSLPIGSIEVIFEDIVELYKNQLTEIPDNFNRDTIDSFLYNDKLYFSPQRFDTTVIKGFDFENLSTDLDKITQMTFRTNVDNGIPGNCEMQLYFMDNALNILDSLYYEQPLAIASAPTNDDGLPTGPYQLRKNDTPLSQEQINLLQDVDVIGLKFIIDIKDFSETNTNYQPDQKIWIQFGVTLTLELEV